MGNCEPDTPQVFNSARVLENIEIQQKEMTCCFRFFVWFFSVMETVSSYFMGKQVNFCHRLPISRQTCNTF